MNRSTIIFISQTNQS